MLGINLLWRTFTFYCDLFSFLIILKPKVFCNRFNSLNVWLAQCNHTVTNYLAKIDLLAYFLL